MLLPRCQPRDLSYDGKGGLAGSPSPSQSPNPRPLARAILLTLALVRALVHAILLALALARALLLALTLVHAIIQSADHVGCVTVYIDQLKAEADIESLCATAGIGNL